MAFLRLRLKMWDSGVLISMATDFKSFIETPSISKLDLGWNPLIMSTISPGLVRENSSVGALLFFRKLSGSMFVSPIDFTTSLPAFAKYLLNSLGMIFGSSMGWPCTVILLIFDFFGSEPIASLINSHVFLGFFCAFSKFALKYIFLLALRVFV